MDIQNNHNAKEHLAELNRTLHNALKYHSIDNVFDIETLTALAQKTQNNLTFCDLVLDKVQFDNKIELLNMINLLSDFWYFIPRKELDGNSIASNSDQLMSMGPIGRYLSGIRDTYVKKYLKELPFPLNPDEVIYFSKKIGDEWMHTPQKILGGLSPDWLIEEEQKGQLKMEPTLEGFMIIHDQPMELYGHVMNSLPLPKQEKDTIEHIIKNLDNYNDQQKILAIKSWLSYILDSKNKIKENDVSIYSAALEYIIQTKLSDHIPDDTTNALKNVARKYKIRKTTSLKDMIEKIEKYLKN